MSITNNDLEELRIRCDALRGLLYAECGFELEQIAAVEEAALLEYSGKLRNDVLVKAALPLADTAVDMASSLAVFVTRRG